MRSWDEEVAVVSGGGTGIGLAIARGFIEAGAAVAIAGRRTSVVEEAAKSLASGSGRAIAVTADVSRPGDCAALVEAARAAFGTVSILVNNAGVATPGPLRDMREADVHAMVDVDLKGPIFLVRAALPDLEAAGAGGGASILNISSSVTLQALENYSVYSSTKAGLDMLTRCWARELAPSGIRVNSINPGIVETPVFETMMPRDEIPAFLRRFDELVPLGRVGQPLDIARLAVFLSSPESAWTTGAIVAVDGGLSLVS